MGGFFSNMGGGLQNTLTGAGNTPQQLQGLSSQEAALAPQMTQLVPAVTQLAQTQGLYGTDVLGTAYNQYLAGASGQLTPAQQAMVTQQLGQANVGTQSTYGNLGLGGSTMEGQDLNANSLASLAEQANLEAQSETLGLQGLNQGNALLSGAEGGYGTAGNLLTGAGNLLGGAAGTTANAGKIAESQQQSFLSALTSLGNKNAPASSA